MVVWTQYQLIFGKRSRDLHNKKKPSKISQNAIKEVNIIINAKRMNNLYINNKLYFQSCVASRYGELVSGFSGHTLIREFKRQIVKWTLWRVTRMKCRKDWVRLTMGFQVVVRFDHGIDHGIDISVCVSFYLMLLGRWVLLEERHRKTLYEAMEMFYICTFVYTVLYICTCLANQGRSSLVSQPNKNNVMQLRKLRIVLTLLQ